MHVAADLNWFLQFIVLAFAGAFGLLYLVRNTASRYFVVDSNFDSSSADYSSLHSRKRENNMAETGGRAVESFDSCAVCGLLTKKQCARCKMVKYCSEACQKSHWDSGHKKKCNDLQSSYKANHTRPTSAFRGRKASVVVGGSSNKILFPYEEFVEFFSWEKPGYPPCGLLNCGNSCFANVVLQCLTYTRPLVAYLLEKGHRIECQRDDWCFLCEFQKHVGRASRSLNPFSPMNILSRLPNIGGNLGYGKQEDAHEFMRFAIDTMQSVCLDEFGGEKAVHPSYQETTLIQHIFGGRLQSQVICAECNNVSNQFENMMDLTVEIHGDVGSLEECLDQFTAKERLHGDNMYKCDGCNAYVMAWKRLTIQRAPNILTIALKRFQSGRFGKLNKRVTFPETLDLSPYMSELEDGNDFYKLYAVIVHVDMLNASFFGHYICYIQDFRGNWYRIDDCKVASVDLDEVLSQGAYMLLYSRIRARPSCLLPAELLKKEESANVKINEVDPSLIQPAECVDSPVDSGQSVTANGPVFKVNSEEELLTFITTEREEDERGDIKMVSSDPISPIVKDIEMDNTKELPIEPNPTNISSIDTIFTQLEANNSEPSPSISDVNGSKNDVDLSLSRKLTEEYENCSTFEKGSMACDVNDLPSSDENQCFVKKSGEASPVQKFMPLFAPGFLEKRPRKLTEESAAAESCSFEKGSATCEMRSPNSTCMSENIGQRNGLPSSDENQGFVKKSGEASPAQKFKPPFAPGFLEKKPRKKFIMPEGKVFKSTLERGNEVAEFRLSCENGGLLKEDKPQVVHENGKASEESYVCKSLENGEYGVMRG